MNFHESKKGFLLIIVWCMFVLLNPFRSQVIFEDVRLRCLCLSLRVTVIFPQKMEKIRFEQSRHQSAQQPLLYSDRQISSFPHKSDLRLFSNPILAQIPIFVRESFWNPIFAQDPFWNQIFWYQQRKNRTWIVRAYPYKWGKVIPRLPVLPIWSNPSWKWIASFLPFESHSARFSPIVLCSIGLDWSGRH